MTPSKTGWGDFIWYQSPPNHIYLSHLSAGVLGEQLTSLPKQPPEISHAWAFEAFI